MEESLLNIIKVFGGFSVIIIAVLSYIAKLLLNGVQNKYKKDIEILKNSFQNELSRVRQYNDISKETYQRLFDKKISVYQQLNNILHEYKSKVYESSEYSWSPSGQENNHEKAFLDLSYEIKKLVAKNQLVISDEISIKYKEIYKEQSKYFIEHKIMSEDPDSVNPIDYHDMVRNLKKESEKKVLELINIVEKDISKIRQYLSGY